MSSSITAARQKWSGTNGAASCGKNNSVSTISRLHLTCRQRSMPTHPRENGGQQQGQGDVAEDGGPLVGSGLADEEEAQHPDRGRGPAEEAEDRGRVVGHGAQLARHVDRRGQSAEETLPPSGVGGVLAREER